MNAIEGRKETNMIINRTNRTIVMTKKEAKASSRFGTEEYYNLVEAMNAFPKFKVEVRKTAKRAEDKGLTYEFMKAYIEEHDDANKTNLKAFEDKTATSAEAKLLNKKPMSYPKVKQWFLETYPEFDAFEEKRKSIIKSENANKVLNVVA